MDSVVYFVDAASPLDVNPDGSIELDIRLGAGPGLRAGVDGSGDSDLLLADDASTKSTTGLARNVEVALDDGNSVLPIMVSYTCNHAGGNVEMRLNDETSLMHGFGNYILALELAAAARDEEHPVPAGFAINPDFLSACQQADLPPEYEVWMRRLLLCALDYRNIDIQVPDSITDTLRGYVLSVNWLSRLVGPHATFGWHVNPCLKGRSQWIHSNNATVVDSATKMTAYVGSLGVFDGDGTPPDFFTVDCYEADDFTHRGYDYDYCFGPPE
ncbi:hypothetical protein CDD83_6686 [Cordyceps sp. RAO-2017]|nr:hypothetical protein CDD83_6686 [Cordyceps sp. RAO-2017]